MIPFVEGIYVAEIAGQARAAVRAAGAFDAALHSGDAAAAHDHIADFLNHAAVISKLLKPGGKEGDPRRTRGRHLRRTLGVPDDAPVLDRRLRDLLEHIDERIDEWAKGAQGVGGCFIDQNIASPGGIVIEGVDQAKLTLRNLDPGRMVCSVLGAEYNLGELAASLRDVHGRAERRGAVLRSHGPEGGN